MSQVRTARTALGLSQAELAVKLGVHQTTISRFETGDLPVDERTELALDALLLRAKRQLRPTEQGRVAA